MTAVDVHTKIVEVSERVVAGTLTITNARLELATLAKNAKAVGCIIDPTEIMFHIEKDYAARLSLAVELIAPIVENDGYESSYVEDDTDYESSYGSSSY